jgi:hypothetical protein
MYAQHFCRVTEGKPFVSHHKGSINAIEVNATATRNALTITFCA